MAHKNPEERVVSRDVPRLLDLLACDDVNAQAQTLTLLCPCRNVRYDKEVWVAIFKARECAESPVVRDRAEHAIGTLLERARTDPRSQELLRWLVAQQVGPSYIESRIPTYRPNPYDNLQGLFIPRFEHSHRSRKNRRAR
jgi:hypothetical protein